MAGRRRVTDQGQDWPVESILNWRQSTDGTRSFEILFRATVYDLDLWTSVKRAEAVAAGWVFTEEPIERRTRSNPRIRIIWAAMWVEESDLNCPRPIARFMATNPAPVVLPGQVVIMVAGAQVEPRVQGLLGPRAEILVEERVEVRAEERVEVRALEAQEVDGTQGHQPEEEENPPVKDVKSILEMTIDPATGERSFMVQMWLKEAEVPPQMILDFLAIEKEKKKKEKENCSRGESEENEVAKDFETEPVEDEDEMDPLGEGVMGLKDGDPKVPVDGDSMGSMDGDSIESVNGDSIESVNVDSFEPVESNQKEDYDKERMEKCDKKKDLHCGEVVEHVLPEKDRESVRSFDLMLPGDCDRDEIDEEEKDKKEDKKKEKTMTTNEIINDDDDATEVEEEEEDPKPEKSHRDRAVKPVENILTTSIIPVYDTDQSPSAASSLPPSPSTSPSMATGKSRKLSKNRLQTKFGVLKKLHEEDDDDSDDVNSIRKNRKNVFDDSEEEKDCDDKKECDDEEECEEEDCDDAGEGPSRIPTKRRRTSRASVASSTASQSKSTNSSTLFRITSLKCPECAKVCQPNQLLGHLWRRHQIRKRRCLVKDCKRSYANTIRMHDHLLKAHRKVDQWQCGFCPEKYSTYAKLSAHNASLHLYGQYVCTQGDCEFESNCRLHMYYHHKRTHRPFLHCDQPGCEHQCRDPYAMRQHALTHSLIKTYQCKWTQCKYASAHRHSTLNHILKQHLTLRQLKIVKINGEAESYIREVRV